MLATLPAPRRAKEPRDAARVPKTSPWLVSWFGKYAHRYVRRHFHAVRVSQGGMPARDIRGPLVIFGNHSSWWDPLIAIILARRFFPGRELFAPIDAAALARYRFFERLGFYGVELESPRGGARFLRVSTAILRKPDAMLWLTPQGRFADPRERPVRFKPGIGHLAAHTAQAAGAVFLPVAAEYVFWQERTPEALIRFGTPLSVDGEPDDPHAWTHRLETALAATQDALARESKSRDPSAFETILSGRAGVGGVYDQWRKIRARLRGEVFEAKHGA